MTAHSKRIISIVFIIASIASLAFVPWSLLKAWILPLPDTVQKQVDEGISHGIDGMIVYIDKGGKQPIFHSTGWNNRENKVPADPQSLFKIASISKLYIATAVAKLVHDERLSLDKTINDYLPEISTRIENADQITLRMLVQHRSGIPDYSEHPDYPWDSPYKVNSDTYELVYDVPADFKPNKKYSYSNTNYLLIGDILDKTLGYRHHQYIREAILEPMGLQNTFSLMSEVDIDDVMSGYYVGYEPDIKFNDFIQPGGSMIATAQDVGIFLRALNDGSLLNKDEQAIYSSIYKYDHTGLLPGYQSIAKYYKDIDTVVVQFSNTSGTKMWSISQIVHNRIMKIRRNKKD